MRILLFGTFDRLHEGHKFVFAQALKRGSVAVVVARDTTVETIKKRKPVQSQEERMREIREMFPQVEVMLGDEHDYLRPVRTHAPDLILLGYDQSLPPGVTEGDIPCPVERLPALEPDRFKSSKLR